MQVLEWLALLSGLACLLLAVTLVGHTVWLLLAMIFRPLFRSPQSDRQELNDQLMTLLQRKAISAEQFRQMVNILHDPQAVSASSAAVASPPPSTARAPGEVAAEAGVQPPAQPATPLPTAYSRPSAPPPRIDDDVVAAEVIESHQAGPSQSTAIHPLDRPPDTAPSARMRRRRTLADVLQMFMEESNIRWIELIGGLLIIGGAICLVVSIQATLSNAVPYFPALIFMLITAAINGAGLYTLRRWKLHATSRGVLVIGLLLVPLNFVAAIALSGKEERMLTASDPRFLIAVLVGVSAFLVMTIFSSRALLPSAWWQLTLAIIGTSCGQILINRLADRVTNVWQITGLLALPVFSYSAALADQLAPRLRVSRLSGRSARELLALLGIASFSLAAPLGLLIAKADRPRLTLAQLSPLTSVAVSLILAIGLVIHLRLQSRRLAALRAAGTAVALLGGALLLALVGLAWPHPSLLIATGLLNALLLAGMALAGDIVILHAAAVACLAVAYLIAFTQFQERIQPAGLSAGRQLLSALLTGGSSVALSVLTALVALLAAALHRTGQRNAASGYGAAATGLALGSVALAAYVAFWPGVEVDDAALATPVLLLFAAVFLIAAVQTGHVAVGWLGSLLLLMGLGHGLVSNAWVSAQLERLEWSIDQPLRLAALGHAAWITGVVIFVSSRPSLDPRRSRKLIVNLAASALASSVLAAALVTTSIDQYGSSAAYTLCLAGIWLGLATATSWAPLLTAFQAMATASIVLLTLSIGQSTQWWNGSLLDHRYAAVVISVLALWCLAWSGLRMNAATGRPLHQAVHSPWLMLDSGILAALIILLIAMSGLLCIPGIAAELSWSGTWVEQIDDWAVASSLKVHWLAFTCILLALLGALVHRAAWDVLAAMLVLGSAPALLLAVPFEQEAGSASALRWTLAMYTLVTGLLIISRRMLGRRARALLPIRPLEPITDRHLDALRTLALILGGLPVLGLTLAAVLRAADDAPFGGPEVESWFARIGPAANYAVPLLLLVVTLIGHAVRERSAGFMLGGAALFQLAVNLAYVLRVLTSGTAMDAAATVDLLQWNALAFTAFAIVWLALQRWIERPQQRPASIPAGSPLLLQLLLGLAAVSVLSAWAAGTVWLDPDRVSAADLQLGGLLGYVAVGLLVVGWLWWAGVQKGRTLAHLLGGVFLLVSGFIAVSLKPASAAGSSYLSFHVLSGSWLVGLLICSTASCVTAIHPRWPAFSTTAARWTFPLSALLLWLCGTAVMRDPWPWWPGSIIAGTAGGLVLLGVVRGGEGYRWASSALAAVAAILLAIAYWSPVSTAIELVEAIQLTLLTVTLMSAMWLAIELYQQVARGRGDEPDRLGAPPLHQWGPLLVMLLFFALSAGLFGFTTLLRANDERAFADASNLYGACVLVAAGLTILGVFWDRRVLPFIGPLCYAWGLLMVLMLLDQWEDLPWATNRFGGREQLARWSLGLTAVGAAAYLALVGTLCSRLPALRAIAQRLRMPEPAAAFAGASTWLPILQSVLALMIAAAGLVIVLTVEPRGVRICAGFAAAIAAAGFPGLARWTSRRAYRFLTLGFVSLAVVYLSWADMVPAWNEMTLLTRSVRLLMALATLSFLYGVLIVRVLSDQHAWQDVVRRAAMACAAAALLALLLVLSLEVAFFDPVAGSPLTTVQTIAVAVFLIGLIIALISLAVLPGSDPLTLSERGRMIYVYAAQLTGALLFAHIFLTNPEWFSGTIRPYWPYIIMAIAFAGVAVGEMLQRKGVRVLGEPLERSGVFLPLLPALAFWVLVSDNPLSYEFNDISYAGVLFTVGLLYLVATMLRPSYLSALAAVLAGNGALWVLLTDEGLSFLRHPQLWLIPPALCVLLAAQINRQRLSSNQLTAVRYACAIVIYLSSTSEMFVSGIAESLWRPIVLALLSVGGVFAGIILQVRAFLYLGCSFLLLAIVGMVWHASSNINHAWPWFAFTMALGIGILIVFGIFEKKRQDVVRLIDQLRQWDR